MGLMSPLNSPLNSNKYKRSFTGSLRGSLDSAMPLFDKRPAPISNKYLMDLRRNPDELTLVEDLIEHHDYVAILPKVWNYLISWYGFTDKEPILRPVRFEKKKARHFIDLYLENRNMNESELNITGSYLDDSLVNI